MTRYPGHEGWTGVVLAGGRSSRMGHDKALIEIEGRSLLQRALDKLYPHVEELLVIGDPMKYGHVGERVVPDEVAGAGPLGGLVTALKHARNARLLVLACDMPQVSSRLLERLKQGLSGDRSAFVPVCDGSLEPLAAAYHRRCLPVFEERLGQQALKLSDALEAAGATFVQICPGEEGWPPDLFRNINTPGDL